MKILLHRSDLYRAFRAAHYAFPLMALLALTLVLFLAGAGTAAAEGGDSEWELLNDALKYCADEMCDANMCQNPGTAVEAQCRTVTLTQDITIDADIALLVQGTVTLDLKGKSITGLHQSPIIKVQNGGNLTLTDSSPGKTGRITHNGSVIDMGGVTVTDRSSTFTMEGGTISGNGYSGVYVGEHGAFIMKGGTISGNGAYSGGGVYVSSNSSFTMSGGTISGNIGSRGGGVYVGKSGTFNLSGSPKISGNFYDNLNSGTMNDLWLDCPVINVSGELPDNKKAQIGIAYAGGNNMDEGIVFTDGLNGNGSPDYFFSDASDRTIAEKDGEAVLVSLPAAPTFTPAGGDYIGPQTVSISCTNANASIYYETGGSDPTTGSTLYTAPFTIIENTTVKAIAVNKYGFSGDVAAAEYTITPATYSLTVTSPKFSDADYGYDQPDAATVTITGSGNSDATIQSVALSVGTAFTIDDSQASYTVTVGQKNETWKIKPKSGLPVKTYTDTITVTYNDGATTTADVSFTVKPKAVTVTADNKTMLEGDAFPTLTASVDGTLGNDTVVYSLSREGDGSAGSHTIKVTGEPSQGNYAVSFVDGELIISAKDAAPISTLPEAAAGWTEDGKSHALLKTAGVSGGGTFCYRLGDNGEWTADPDSLQASTVATYKIYYYVMGEGVYKNNGSDSDPFGPLTVTVTPAEKIVKTEKAPLEKVPEELKAKYQDNIETLRQDMLVKLEVEGEPAKVEQTVFYDVELKASYDGGNKWEIVTVDNFPEDGLEVTLPYPEGTGKDTHNFSVIHMFAVTNDRLGTKAGEMEYPKVSAEDDGLHVVLRGLSPVAIAWSEKEPEGPSINFFRLYGECELPATGFSSLRPTVLSGQPKELRYEPLRMRLMLPTLGTDTELVTVPQSGNSWAVDWLGADAGILEGSALPGEGVSIIAAHNTLNDTAAGPFALLGILEPNDLIAVAGDDGSLKLFRVYANELLTPDGMKTIEALAAENSLVLVTCENESPDGTYHNRRAVFAK